MRATAAWRTALSDTALSESHDGATMLELLKLGVPVDSADLSSCDFNGAGCAVTNDALFNQREILVEPRIAKGILNTLGKPDQRKIDAAFYVAIAGGRPASVKARPPAFLDYAQGETLATRGQLAQGPQ